MKTFATIAGIAVLTGEAAGAIPSATGKLLGFVLQLDPTVVGLALAAPGEESGEGSGNWFGPVSFEDVPEGTLPGSFSASEEYDSSRVVSTTNTPSFGFQDFYRPEAARNKILQVNTEGAELRFASGKPPGTPKTATFSATVHFHGSPRRPAVPAEPGVYLSLYVPEEWEDGPQDGDRFLVCRGGGSAWLELPRPENVAKGGGWHDVEIEISNEKAFSEATVRIDGTALVSGLDAVEAGTGPVVPSAVVFRNMGAVGEMAGSYANGGAAKFPAEGRATIGSFRKGPGNTWTLAAFAELEEGTAADVADGMIRVRGAETPDGLDRAEPMTGGVSVKAKRDAVMVELEIEPEDGSRFFRVGFSDAGAAE